MRKFLALFLALVTVLGCGFGCGKKQLTIDDLAVPTYVDDKSFKMYCDLPPDMSSMEQMQLYKDLGMTAIPITEDFFPAGSGAFFTALEICEELDIDAYIRAIKGVSEKQTDEPNYFESHFSDIDFRDYPSVKGFYVCDEPTWAQLEDVERRYLPWFNENYGGEHFEWVLNLFGAQVTTNIKAPDKTAAEYTEYYLGMLDQINAPNKVHSIDYYALQYDGKKYWMVDTNVMVYVDAAKRANAHNVGLAAYVQTFGGGVSGQTYRIPESIADIKWSMYNILSYGASTIKFFGYRDWPQGNLRCMVTDGVPNEVYYWTKDVIADVKKIEHVLLAFNWEGVYTNVGSGSRNATNEAFEIAKARDYVMDKLSGISGVKSKYDLTVSEFSDGTNDGFMIFNYDDPVNRERKNKTEITFEKADGVMYYRNGEPTIEVLGADKVFTVELDPGEGVFAIPLYAKK